jgi:hypothetical protein
MMVKSLLPNLSNCWAVCWLMISKTMKLLNAGSKQGAFSAIRKQFFSAKGIKNSHKKTAYEGLILSILLYGCETHLGVRPKKIS